MTTDVSRQLVRVHRRQYVLGPRFVQVLPEWRRFEIDESCVLSADPELRVGATTDSDGGRWLLLGVAVDTRPEFAEPLAEVGRRRTSEVPGLSVGWSGRWALIGAGSFYPDASALLGCYYGRSTDGEAWASSSPALIRRLVSVEASCPDGGREVGTWKPAPNASAVSEPQGISWFPPPYSGIPSVFRLLPSQTLSLREASPVPRRLSARLDRTLDEPEVVTEIGRSLRVAIQRLAAMAEPDELTLLLSGGSDSRMLLSAAVAGGVHLQTYTRVHRRGRLADELLPPRLSRVASYRHLAHRQARELPGRREAILEHAGYSVSWRSAREFLEGGSDPLTGIALIGFGAELGRKRYLPDVPFEDVTGAMMARHLGERDEADVIAAFDAWLEWRRDHPDPAFDLSDAFFLEQRLAGRKGAKEQICDLFRFERVPPFNSARIFAVIAQLEPSVRAGPSWIRDVVRGAAPDLLRDPMNPPDSYFGFVRGTLLNYPAYGRRLRNLLRGSREAGPHRRMRRQRGATSSSP